MAELQREMLAFKVSCRNDKFIDCAVIKFEKWTSFLVLVFYLFIIILCFFKLIRKYILVENVYK